MAIIHTIRTPATPEQIQEMRAVFGTFIKLAVDVRRRILAGGGPFHADCETVLLQDGSQQTDVWGADWYPDSREVQFESLINIRPRQGNRSMILQDPALRQQIESIVRHLLER